jgi:hypothetical protein
VDTSKHFNDVEIDGSLLSGEPDGIGVYLGPHDDGSFSMTFRDSSGTARISIVMNPDGRPQLLFRDKNQTVRIQAELTRKGEPQIIFFDAKGKATKEIL